MQLSDIVSDSGSRSHQTELEPRSRRVPRTTWVERPKSAEELRALIDRQWIIADREIRHCALCKAEVADGERVFRGTLNAPDGFVMAKFCRRCRQANDALTEEVLSALDRTARWLR
jgi:hypothetical protein